MKEIEMKKFDDYPLNFPDYPEFKKQLNDCNREGFKKDEEEYDATEFFRDWIDSSINGLIWDIMTDHTSEGLCEDERDYIENESDEEVWLKVAENMMGQILKIARNSITDEEILERIPKKFKDRYYDLKNKIEKVRNVSKL